MSVSNRIRVIEFFQLKEDNPSQRNCQNQLSHLGLSLVEQEHQKSFIQGKIHV